MTINPAYDAGPTITLLSIRYNLCEKLARQKFPIDCRSVIL